MFNAVAAASVMVFLPLPRLHALVSLILFHNIFSVPFAVGEIALQQIALWSSLDACAQKCALSVSSSCSSSLQCPATDPNSCLCNLGPLTQLGDLAHQCASTSCTNSSSSIGGPERAGLALTAYCSDNAHLRSVPTAATTTTAPTDNATTITDPTATETASAAPAPTTTVATVTSATGVESTREWWFLVFLNE